MGRRLRRALLGCGLALAVATATIGSATLAPGPGDGAADASGPSGTATPEWVATWGVALAEAGTVGQSADGFADTTLRQLARLSIGGDTVRVRLANTFGDRPLEVSAATVAPASGAGSAQVGGGALRDLAFDGRPEVVVPVGGTVASDPVDLTVPDGGTLAVSLHLPGPTGPATWLPSGFATSYAAPGDATRDPGGAFAPLDTSRYYLAGVDVVAPDAEGAVVLLGDSITAGADSTLDADRRYPDALARRLLSEHTARCGVVNAGIGGNRLLTDDDRSGAAVPARLDRDVLDVPGATSVVVLVGINDIGGSRGDLDALRLVDAHRAVVRRIHAAGLRAVGATLLPYGGAGYATPAGEADRRELNRWIRTSGTYDAVLDLDRVMRDPRRPTRLWPDYDSGDHLHPNDAGLEVVADAVDLDTVC